jgi:hypothetical protein
MQPLGAEQLRFIEEHTMPRWTLVVIVALMLFPAALIGSMAASGKHGSAQALWIVLGGMIALNAVAVWLLWALRCQVAVTEATFHLRVSPVGPRRRVALEDIVHVAKMKPSAGVGVNWRGGGRWNINFGCSGLVRIATRDGRTYDLGSDRPEELIAALGGARSGGERLGATT